LFKNKCHAYNYSNPCSNCACFYFVVRSARGLDQSKTFQLLVLYVVLDSNCISCNNNSKLGGDNSLPPNNIFNFLYTRKKECNMIKKEMTIEDNALYSHFKTHYDTLSTHGYISDLSMQDRLKMEKLVKKYICENCRFCLTCKTGIIEMLNILYAK
jgi:hypothetical protein